ncbi:S-adenosyl-L-methionine-dependent methyltransferase [Linnemannia elongata]|nr:S-adenosyl-L-methionine-dependent methyltransferase [Linnemannia elongata]
MSKTAIEAHEQNRASWNEAVVAHNSHKVDQDGFFRNKGSTLYPEEIGLLGNLAGLKVCHLQCNAGQDTLSLVTRLGAENPIGVDISDNAIEFATKLAKDSGIQATFVRADVFEFFDTTEASQFDVVFVSYGTVNWLVDLERWGRGVHKILKSGGRIVFIDFHPVCYIFNEDMVHHYPYSSAGKPIHESGGVSDYVAYSNTGGEVMPNLKYQEGVQDFRNPNASVEFCWGLSDTIGSLVKAGMHLTHFKEYPYSNFFRPYKAMTSEHVEEGPRWRSTGPMLPLMYSVCASKL